MFAEFVEHSSFHFIIFTPSSPLQAVTPPDAATQPTCPSSMPTAAAVAAAAVTAKITALEAVNQVKVLSMAGLLYSYIYIYIYIYI